MQKTHTCMTGAKTLIKFQFLIPTLKYLICMYKCKLALLWISDIHLITLASNYMYTQWHL